MPVPPKPAAIELLRSVAALLEYRGENTFKVRAYENAARALAAAPATFEELIEPKRLEQVRGIGKAIAELLREFATTGTTMYYDELSQDAPTGIQQLLQVPKLGLKKIKLLHERLGVNTVEDLERVAREGKIEALPGFGKTSGEFVLASLGKMQRFSGQLILHHALRIAPLLLKSLRACPAVIRAEIAGSVRRWNEIVADLDFVASSNQPEEVAACFAELPFVMEVIAQGNTKTSVRLDRGIQADLRIVTDEEFAAALHHFTGSKEHNAELRALAKTRNLLVNEYGLFRAESKGRSTAARKGRARVTQPEEDGATATGERIPISEEADLYRELGMDYIAPEMREGQGEIALAVAHKLPRLITLEDYKGVIHCHTDWSDGSDSIHDMALAARDEWGFEYFAVCDHSELASYAGGVKRQDLAAQHAEIDEVNAKLGRKNFRVLKSCECDILADGRLDYPDEYLAPMDLVVASVHSRFKQTRAEMTSRLLAAVENPYTTILGHLSGRLLLSRDPYDFDIEAVLRRAGETGTIIEINADPHRLDLDWRYCRRAKELGVRFAINPDAHDAEAFSYIRYGIAMARKGWLESSDVLNCLPLKELLKEAGALRKRKLEA
ncbi:MAG: helix-hairpin-helix domain-containing protein [Candidatus Sumerlaeaceae bacterium]